MDCLTNVFLFRLYQEMPFSNKGEFKTYMKEYVRKIRQEMKAAGKEQEEIKK